jgi:hypothetical protein
MLSYSSFIFIRHYTIFLMQKTDPASNEAYENLHSTIKKFPLFDIKANSSLNSLKVFLLLSVETVENNYFN